MEETSSSNSLSYTVNLDISEAKKNAEELAKAYADLQVQTTGMVVTIDVDSALEQVKSLTDQLKELQGILESNKDSTSAYKSVLSELSDDFNTVKSGVDEYKAVMKELDDTVTKISDLYTEFTIILTSIADTQDIATLAATDAAIAQEALSEGLITATEAEEAFALALETSVAATEAVTAGLELFRAALASTGVGLLLVALGSLVAYFTQTQEGMDEVSSALEPLEVGFNFLTKSAIDLGKGILNAFSLDGLKKFGDLIENQVINRFKALGIIMDGLIHLDFAKVGVGLVQSATGVVDFTGKISSGFQSLQAYGGKIVDVAAQISALKEQQEKQVASQDLNLQTEGAIVKKSTETAKDPANDKATRAAAVQAGLAAIKEELRLKNSLLDLNKQIAALENAGKPSPRDYRYNDIEDDITIH